MFKFELKRTLRAKKLARLIITGKSTRWLWLKSNQIPQPIKLGNRVTVWPAEAIQSFTESFSRKEAE